MAVNERTDFIDVLGDQGCRANGHREILEVELVLGQCQAAGIVDNDRTALRGETAEIRPGVRCPGSVFGVLRRIVAKQQNVHFFDVDDGFVGVRKCSQERLGLLRSRADETGRPYHQCIVRAQDKITRRDVKNLVSARERGKRQCGRRIGRRFGFECVDKEGNTHWGS
ncbi:hypothetical protein D9M72_481550 [compost metagenome]